VWKLRFSTTLFCFHAKYKSVKDTNKKIALGGLLFCAGFKIGSVVIGSLTFKTSIMPSELFETNYPPCSGRNMNTVGSIDHVGLKLFPPPPPGVY